MAVVSGKGINATDTNGNVTIVGADGKFEGGNTGSSTNGRQAWRTMPSFP
jgi:hypothetical protein